jgi:hypothetical protein
LKVWSRRPASPRRRPRGRRRGRNTGGRERLGEGVEGGRLAGPGAPDDGDDAVATRRRRPHHRLLVGGEREALSPARDDTLDGVCGNGGGAAVAHARDERECRTLEGEQLARRIEGGTPRLRRLPDPCDLREREEAGADPAQPLAREALLVRLSPGHEELGLREGAPLLGQPLVPEQPLGEPKQLRRCELAVRSAAEERLELGVPEPVLGRARPPFLAQADEVDFLLALARLERRHAAGVEAGCSVLGEVLEHLAASAGEGAKRLLRDTGDLGHALHRRRPLDAERAGEFGAEVGLVEVAGGEAVGREDGLAVERPPLPVARALGHVGDEHVRVQVRVLRTRGAMLVRGHDEAGGALADDAVSAPASDAGLRLEVGEGRLPGVRVGLHDRQPGLFVAEGVEEADALGRAEDEVEAGDGSEPLLLYPSLPARRVDPLDLDRPRGRMLAKLGSRQRMKPANELPQLALLDDAFQIELLGASTGPDTRRLAFARVVVVDTRRHRALVVALLAGRELGDAEHSSKTL